MKIGIITSGGDAPGMNAILIDLIHVFKNQNYNVILFNDGFEGLLNNDYIEVKDINEFDQYKNDAGSFIYCSRSKRFISEYNLAIHNLNNHKIDCLIVIGGDGSFKGANLLFENGFKTIFIPATIDNDIKFTDYTIGFGSAINEIVEQSNKIIKTFKTHKNVILLEVMGRYCSDLAIYASKQLEPTLVLTHENKLNERQILEFIQKYYFINRYAFVLVSEHLYSKSEIDSILNLIVSKIGCSARFNILGYSQRGANVVEKEIVLSDKIANLVLENIDSNIYNFAVIIQNEKVLIKKYKDILN